MRLTIKKIITVFSLVLCIRNAHSEPVAGDTLAADFKHLVKILEETHPDPYSGFGGKVFFHKQASGIEQKLKKGATPHQFAQTIQAFLSTLEDGHTYINQKHHNAHNDKSLKLPIGFTVIPGGLIVSRIPKKHEKLLGSKLTSINGLPVSELCNRAGRLSPCENIYGKYHWLSSAIGNYGKMRHLLPDMDETAVFKFETPGEETHTIRLTYSNDIALPETAEVPRWSKIRDEFLYYDYLDNNKQAMYFRLASIMTKEPFVYMRQNNWNNIDGMLKGTYNYLKRKMPADTDEAINALPPLVKTFGEMLETMKADKAKYLIIDLRKNTGGFTPITLPTLYMLYGDSFLQKEMDIQSYRLISPLLMKKYNTTLDEYNSANNTNYQFGDYVFPVKENQKHIPVTEKREKLVNEAMGDAADYIKDLNGKPLYTPQNVYVLTDEGTFSAAFHYAFYLWKMGATVIGVPSRQAPNTFMEGTFFELPLTKLNGSVSNSFQTFVPPGDKREKVFYPDIMPDWKDYARYEFDKHSELLYLIDLLKLKLENN